MLNLYSELRAQYLTEWRIWYRMCKRCNDDMDYYVETQVCDEWQGQQGFVNWFDYMGPRPHNRSTMDRINKFGDYEPGNVEWTTKEVSASRMRQHLDPEQQSYWKDVAKSNGINRHTFYTRVRDHGWNWQDAATLPPHSKKYRKRTV